MPRDYVIITGAYGGLGKALSLAFAKQGYGLILFGRKEDALNTEKNKLSQHTDVLVEVCDVSDWDSCKVTYNKIKKTGIRTKILINNAAITYIQNFNKDYDIQQYQQLINTNLNGYVFMSKLFIDDLVANKGSIINISSVIGYAPLIGRSAYAASKFGIEGFFSVLQAEMEDKLHIMMVYPTFIATYIRDKSNVSIKKHEVLTANLVAKKIAQAYNQKKKKVYIGLTAKLTYYLYKFTPKLFINLMRKNI